MRSFNQCHILDGFVVGFLQTFDVVNNLTVHRTYASDIRTHITHFGGVLLRFLLKATQIIAKCLNRGEGRRIDLLFDRLHVVSKCVGILGSKRDLQKLLLNLLPGSLLNSGMSCEIGFYAFNDGLEAGFGVRNVIFEIADRFISVILLLFLDLVIQDYDFGSLSRTKTNLLSR